MPSFRVAVVQLAASTCSHCVSGCTRWGSPQRPTATRPPVARTGYLPSAWRHTHKIRSQGKVTRVQTALQVAAIKKTKVRPASGCKWAGGQQMATGGVAPVAAVDEHPQRPADDGRDNAHDEAKSGAEDFNAARIIRGPHLAALHTGSRSASSQATNASYALTPTRWCRSSWCSMHWRRHPNAVHVPAHAAQCSLPAITSTAA